jgi:hypothetical protein
MPSLDAIGPMTVVSMEGEADSVAESALRWVWRTAIVTLLLVLVVLAWLVAFGNLYEAGSSLGYNLGLIGGLLMLSLLLYPMRKRLRFLERVGSMAGWFRYHMIAGICGPLLVLFHSTFNIGSMNGRIALYAMLLVAGSGIVGRFIYRHVYKDMCGQHLTLSSLERDMELTAHDMSNVFVMCPDFEPRLQSFSTMAFSEPSGLLQRFWHFLTLGFKGSTLAKQLRHDAKTALTRLGRKKKVPRAERILSYRLARADIDSFIEATVLAAQLAHWERLFSLWHVVHTPFTYLLLVSGIVHVVAVHMY